MRVTRRRPANARYGSSCRRPRASRSDFAARLITNRLSEALGRNLIVDNRQSVNGILATELAAKSPPDGNTLLIGNIGTLVMNAGLYKKLPYDTLRDFVPITQLVSAGTALVATPKLAPQTFRDFVAAAKKDPGNSTSYRRRERRGRHEVLKQRRDHAQQHSIQSSAPTEQAIVGVEVDVALLSVPVVAPQVKAGDEDLRRETAKRSNLMPDCRHPRQGSKVTIRQLARSSCAARNARRVRAPCASRGGAHPQLERVHDIVLARATMSLDTPRIRGMLSASAAIQEIIAESGLKYSNPCLVFSGDAY